MKTLLFCLPYAGASASIYQKWRAPLLAQAEVLPLELAGRGSRMGEPFYADMQEAATDAARIIKTELQKASTTRYVLFGHSMGAKVAYETALRLRAMGQPEAEHLILSGALPPHLPFKRERRAMEMSDDEWQRELEQKGGTPAGLLDDPHVRELFLPIIRADYTLLENYKPALQMDKLTMPVTVLTGRLEGPSEPMEEWASYTSGPCRVNICEGGHFFIHEDAEHVLGLMRETLTGDSRRGVHNR
ncbi:thioesterase II family protein [Paenibacillus daejeonensis]|uniref:thioesterase II family protein n=1 Tax=Paenibacillus daejeonensis TaxID=135193 RepID=UPI00037D8CC8|nr:alpha/beta fold hydrolase [Paenibacillus daejeonensis]